MSKDREGPQGRFFRHRKQHKESGGGRVHMEKMMRTSSGSLEYRMGDRPGKGGPCRGKMGGFTFTRGPAGHPQEVRCSPAGDGAPLERWHLDLWF